MESPAKSLNSVWHYLSLLSLYIICAALPFFTTAGRNLEYEYALLTTYFILIIIPTAALILSSKLIDITKPPSLGDGFLKFLWTLFAAPIVVLLPGLYLLKVDICNCSPTGFLFWMCFQAYPAIVLAQAAHFIMIQGRAHGIKKPMLALGLLLIYGGIILQFGLDLWINPQKRGVNLLLGFIHGPIYDQWIAVDHGIALSRLAHWFLGLFFLTVATVRGRIFGIVAPLTVLMLWLGTGIEAQQFPSAARGRENLQRMLPHSFHTPQFVLHFRDQRPNVRRTNDPKSLPTSIQRLYFDASFHIKELSELFKNTAALPKVEIYIYPDEGSKKLWFGGGATDVTDVYTPSIHITEGHWPHPTLRHELVHALASGHSFWNLGFHPNMAFTEGLAMALAPEDRTVSLDDGAMSVIDAGRLEDLETLFSPLGFWSVSGNRAYTVAGSFIQFLINRFGLSAVMDLYGGKKWETSFAESKVAVIDEWKTHVKSHYNKQQIELEAEALFRYPGVFHDVCPHSQVDYTRNRAGSIYDRLRQPLGWDPEQLLDWRLHLKPDDPATRLAKWDKELRTVASDRVLNAAKLTTWLENFQKFRQWPPKTVEDVEMAITESDILRLIGQRDQSMTLIQQLLTEHKRKPFSDALERQLIARRLVEEQLPETSALEWRKYLAGWRFSLPDTTSDEPWILSYLRLRRDSRIYAKREVLLSLTMLPMESTLPRSMLLEWYRQLGQRFMEVGEYGASAVALAAANDYAVPAQRPLIDEHRRRALFYQQKLAGGVVP